MIRRPGWLLVARIHRLAAAHKRPLVCQFAETREKLAISLWTNTLNVVFGANPAAMHMWQTPFKHMQLERDYWSSKRIES